ncbi:hypothetical protein COEX109129_17915 [Corallococcus exiguus]
MSYRDGALHGSAPRGPSMNDGVHPPPTPARMGRSMEGRLLLTNCAVFRAGGCVRHGMAVAVEEGIIRRVDPGLVDCHWHMVNGQLLPPMVTFSCASPTRAWSACARWPTSSPPRTSSSSPAGPRPRAGRWRPPRSCPPVVYAGDVEDDSFGKGVDRAVGVEGEEQRRAYGDHGHLVGEDGARLVGRGGEHVAVHAKSRNVRMTCVALPRRFWAVQPRSRWVLSPAAGARNALAPAATAVRARGDA